MGICGMSFWSYLILFAYPGLSLTLLRSYLEHRAHPDPAARTVVVEAEWPLALMFLNNNLHVSHHEAPQLAWYKLPNHFRTEQARILMANGGYCFEGYREVFGRYFLRCKEHPNLELALAQRQI
jgi:fatty acid desaturase